MSRGYTVEKYKKIIDNIRTLMPHASITADAIVAFPGETTSQFKDTLKLISDIGFDLVNTAAYSPRPNTPAAKWINQIPEEIKKDRLNELNQLVEMTSRKRNQRYLNNIESILIEGYNPKNLEQLMGRTRTNRLTFVEIPSKMKQVKFAGQEFNVMIKEVRSFSLSGVICNL
tara:strand:- start:1438 stop:1953 length:516 start_codon:yes stop_codon:yes gene_type:complete